MRASAFFLILLSALASYPSVAEVSTAYIPNIEISLPPKSDISAIEIYQQSDRPARPAVILGALITDSDGSQNEEQLVAAARKKAADMGADFILISKVSSRTRISRDPSFAFAIPFLRIPIVAGAGQAGDVQRKDIPKILFAIGAYSRSSIAVIWDLEEQKRKRMIVADFRSYSLAEKAGVKRRDEVLEVNGMSLTDKRLQKFFLEAPPGTKVTLFIRRGDERLSIEVETVEPK